MEMSIRRILVLGLADTFEQRITIFVNQNSDDETWVNLNTPKIKCDSMTWKHPSSPVTKKFKVQSSAAKVIATVFWDAKGVILLDILPQGQCINAANTAALLTASVMQFAAKDLDS
ncbi:histone-lysine N-methyltransferase SETMAR [Elysia marginata]|uniref:Histone-lysine N-methyltransferase SETMAR n=1 Tax=Elysia marginata TaxID=1093978 RepID=A0AAV4HZ34_9GAST|nr:histone-lysine N-methyltransferase SETMAR [Elysia marginata]